MSVDGTTYTACGECGRLAHDVEGCAECERVDHTARYCESHRHRCVVCGQTICEPHRTEHAAACVSDLASPFATLGLARVA